MILFSHTYNFTYNFPVSSIERYHGRERVTKERAIVHRAHFIVFVSRGRRAGVCGHFGGHDRRAADGRPKACASSIARMVHAEHKAERLSTNARLKAKLQAKLAGKSSPLDTAGNTKQKLKLRIFWEQHAEHFKVWWQAQTLWCHCPCACRFEGRAQMSIFTAHQQL